MTIDHDSDVPPADARTPVDVYRAGRLAARMWRLDERVTFRYTGKYVARGGPPVAISLPLSAEPVEITSMRVPAFFAGTLPEGDTRRRDLQRAFHLSEQDELGLLAVVGGDLVGDVQVVHHGDPLPEAHAALPEWSEVSFEDLWAQLPGPRSWSSVAGVQPKMSAQSRSLGGRPVGPVILKFPIPGWHAVLRNEDFFMRHAHRAGITAARTRVVTDADGAEALEVERFDRVVDADQVLRLAQEDASQVLGIRPGQKYDPDAHTVVRALAEHCASPRQAARDLFHQLVYSYAVGNNDVHAKNLSIHQGTDGLWRVTPAYDVLHTWPYEGDHRFVPVVRADGRAEAVTRRWWLMLAADVGLPERVTTRILDQVADAVAEFAPETASIGLPDSAHRDLTRVLRRRVRDLLGE